MARWLVRSLLLDGPSTDALFRGEMKLENKDRPLA